MLTLVRNCVSNLHCVCEELTIVLFHINKRVTTNQIPFRQPDHLVLVREVVLVAATLHQDLVEDCAVTWCYKTTMPAPLRPFSTHHLDEGQLKTMLERR